MIFAFVALSPNRGSSQFINLLVIECLSAGMHGLHPEFMQSQAGASLGSIPLWAGGTTENISFLLLMVCRPIIGSDYFEEFHIHFM